MKEYNSKEFYKIINPILQNEEFLKLKEITHHGITRFDHSMRVAYYTYVVTKGMKLNYEEATVAALLHDFFTDEVVEMKSIFRLRRHPAYALENAKKYYDLTDMQKDIIIHHMFPVTFTPPRYLESWIVDFIDDLAALYEQGLSTKKELSAAGTFLFILVIQYLRIRI